MANGYKILGKNFVPAPEVDVGVVRFIPRQEPLIPVAFPVGYIAIKRFILTNIIAI